MNKSQKVIVAYLVKHHKDRFLKYVKDDGLPHSILVGHRNNKNPITDEQFTRLVVSLTNWIPKEDAKTISIPQRLNIIFNGFMHPLSCPNCSKEFVIHTASKLFWYKKNGFKYCSRKCSNSSEAAKKRTEKARVTMKERTGYENAFSNPTIIKLMQDNYEKKTGYRHSMQNPEVQVKSRATCMRIYGFPSVMQNPDILTQMQRSAFTSKEVIYGKKRFSVQGNEEIAIRFIINNLGYSPKELYSQEEMDYYFPYVTKDGKQHTYHPDLFIPTEDRVIEVKSIHTATYLESWWEILKLKRLSVVASGCKFNLLIMGTKCRSVFPEDWFTYSHKRIREFLRNQVYVPVL